MNFVLSYQKLNIFLRSLGVALLIAGMQVGMYLNLYVANMGWNSILYPLALLLVADIRNLTRFRFPLMSQQMFILLIFFDIIWVYILGSSYKGEAKVINSVLISTATLFCLGSMRRCEFNFRQIVFLAWIITSVCCCIGIFSLSFGYVQFEETSASTDVGMDRGTISGGATTCLLLSLFIKSSNNRINLLSRLTIILAFATNIFAGKRTAIILSIIYLLVYLYYNSSRLNFGKMITRIFRALILCIIVLAMFSIEFDVMEKASGLYDHTVNGISDMLTGTSTSGPSARMRYYATLWALNYINTKFTLWNLIFGAGFMTRWLDVPILQSFLDMGLIGLIGYSFFILFLPLRYLFAYARRNPQILFGCMLALANVISTFNSGHPYATQRWIPLILLLVIIADVKHTNKNSANLGNLIMAKR